MKGKKKERKENDQLMLESVTSTLGRIVTLFNWFKLGLRRRKYLVTKRCAPLVNILTSDPTGNKNT